ncbi:MAG TPA: A/G-specific adenine glycosylase [Woeseiaceae bacterium]|nr:A/G-specific adenine glycosylase [Woeseiaceae bacterium]
MTTFSDRVLAWFDTSGRKDLPWQQQPTPYRVWISEIMLQQTQVATVVPYFERFMQSFRDIESLANAHIDDVLLHWSGLGYYARARNLYRTAGILRDEYDGEFPSDLAQLLALPGIGRSTAGAILSLAFGQRQPILDGNVRRVLARFHAVPGSPADSKVAAELWAQADAHTPQQRVAAYTQAMMDLGATVCTRTRPACPVCPLREDCAAQLQGTQAMYPGRKARSARPLRQTCMLLAHVDGAVFLEKRPPSGIWGGLWSLPEVVDATLIDDWCHDRLSAKPESRTEWPILRHSFSHYDLDIRPVVVRLQGASAKVSDPAAGRFIPFGESQGVGLAAPVRKLVTTLQQSGF